MKLHHSEMARDRDAARRARERRIQKGGWQAKGKLTATYLGAVRNNAQRHKAERGKRKQKKLNGLGSIFVSLPSTSSFFGSNATAAGASPSNHPRSRRVPLERWGKAKTAPFHASPGVPNKKEARAQRGLGKSFSMQRQQQPSSPAKDDLWSSNAKEWGIEPEPERLLPAASTHPASLALLPSPPSASQHKASADQGAAYRTRPFVQKQFSPLPPPPAPPSSLVTELLQQGKLPAAPPNPDVRCSSCSQLFRLFGLS